MLSQKTPIDSKITPQSDLSDCRIAIVASLFNKAIVKCAYQAAVKTLNSHNIAADAITTAWVPGAFEIPVMVKNILQSKLQSIPRANHYDAVITLGAVIRGETPHFEYIATNCSHGIHQVALEFSTPVIFGVLFVNNIAQAHARVSDEHNIGTSSALSAIQMIDAIRSLKS